MITIRRAFAHEAAAIADAHIAAWLTTYPGIVPDHVIAQRTDRPTRIALWERRLAARGTHVAVAVDGSTICAFASVSPLCGSLQYDRQPIPGFDAYLDALYALANHRRHGLGRRLLRWVADRVVADGRTSLALHVHARNPARAFYEKLGARFVRDEPPEERGATWHTCVYGWDDVAVLRGSAP